MPHTPISRESMRLLRAQKEEEYRIQRIDQIISEIYQNAIRTAENMNDTRYLYLLPGYYSQNPVIIPHSEFHRNNMVYILQGIQSLFPDCSVKHTKLVMAQTQDGEFIEVSKIEETDSQYFSNIEIREYIVVDWS